MTATFHSKNPALQDSILVFNQDCELVSQLPNSYIFLDCDEYLADQLFIKHNVPVKFGKEYCKNNSRYCVISCKIRKRYEEEFKKALAEMNNKMILRGYTDYADFCENFNTIIDKARCEL